MIMKRTIPVAKGLPDLRSISHFYADIGGKYPSESKNGLAFTHFPGS
jgi:hypothetical protein